VARKTSDIALLLGSRGRGRSRSGVQRLVRGMWESWFGRSPWRDDRPSKHLLVPGWLAAAGVLAAFAGGYLAGGRFGGAAGDGVAGLRAEVPNAPVVFEATEPLEDEAFLVAMYPDAAEAEGSAQAKLFAGWLVEQGLKKAQPYLLPGIGAWSVAVYYGSPAEAQATRDKLAGLHDVPDRAFHDWREQRRKAGEDWPRTWRTR
jgi:hypothetical protein